MNHVDDLRAITRRLTIASNAGRHGTVFQEAKALVEVRPGFWKFPQKEP